MALWVKHSANFRLADHWRGRLYAAQYLLKSRRLDSHILPSCARGKHPQDYEFSGVNQFGSPRVSQDRAYQQGRVFAVTSRFANQYARARGEESSISGMAITLPAVGGEY